MTKHTYVMREKLTMTTMMDIK